MRENPITLKSQVAIFPGYEKFGGFCDVPQVSFISCDYADRDAIYTTYLTMLDINKTLVIYCRFSVNHTMMSIISH